jgi:hypothetical protein
MCPFVSSTTSATSSKSSDQCVLERVRHEQQHHQVEHVDLRQLALPAQPQRHEEEGEDEQ